MAHSIYDDDDFADLSHNRDYRSYMITRRQMPGDYRFARPHQGRGYAQARAALNWVNGFFKAAISAIGDAKKRRLDRELRLRGIIYDPRRGEWSNNG